MLLHCIQVLLFNMPTAYLQTWFTRDTGVNDYKSKPKNALCLLKNNNNFVCLASQYTASLEKLHEICPTSSVK